MPPRTVDNLGVDVSTTYALNQQNVDPTSIEEIRSIPKQTTIDVMVPGYSQFDLFCGFPEQMNSWASFTLPEGYLEQRSNLFSHELIPSLNLLERGETQQKKIESRLTLHSEQEKKEQQVLSQFLQKLFQLDRWIRDIEARRGQYHKG